MDKSLIINDIKKYLKLKTDTDFANYLGITPQTLSNWRARNTIDEKLIAEKCTFLNYQWLLTGIGEMLNSKNNDLSVDNPQNELEYYKSQLELIRELLKEKEKYINMIQPLADQALKEMLERNKPNK